MSTNKIPKTLDDIDQTVYKYHHTASRRGYCRVAEIGSVEPYKGRFGEGFIVREGRAFGSSTDYEAIAYYVKAN